MIKYKNLITAVILVIVVVSGALILNNYFDILGRRTDISYSGKDIFNSFEEMLLFKEEAGQLEFSFGKSKTQEHAHVKDLPEEFKVFIVPDAESVDVERIEYNDGRQGFVVDYVHRMSLSDFRIFLMSLSQMANLDKVNDIFVNNDDNSQFGILEIQNLKYQVAIEYSFIKSGTDVIIRIAEKNKNF